MSFLPLVCNENSALKIELRRFWFDVVSLLICSTLGIVVIAIIAGNYVSDNGFTTTLDRILLAYILWVFSTFSYFSVVNLVRVTGANGFVQQLFVSSVPFIYLVLARITSHLLRTTVLTAVMGFLAMIIVGHWLSLNYVALFALLGLSVPSVLGLGFVVCGLCLQVKGLIIALINFVVSVFLLAVVVLGFVMNSDVLNILPFYPCISIARDIFIESRNLRGLEVFLLLLNSAAYFIVGMTLYSYLESRAKVYDLIGKY